MGTTLGGALGLLVLIAGVGAAHAQPALQLVPPALPPGSGLGSSIAMVGSFVAVGARGGGSLSAPPGAVYLFDRETTAFVRKLTNPNLGMTSDLFGESLAAVGTNILVGAPGDDSGVGTGAAYLFDPATGALLQSFRSPQAVVPACHFNFGISVAAVGSNVLVGAPDDTAGFFPEAGAAYLFDATSGALLPAPAPPRAIASAGAGRDWSRTGQTSAGTRTRPPPSVSTTSPG
jgi:FG-GAP repeat protein